MTKRGCVIVVVQLLVVAGLLCGAELLWALHAWPAGVLACWLSGTAGVLVFYVGAVLWDAARRWLFRQRVYDRQWWRA